MALHQSEELFVSASRDGVVKCWRIDSTTSRTTYTQHQHPRGTGGSTAVGGSVGGSISGNTSTIGGTGGSSHGGIIRDVVFADKGNFVASCDGEIHIWEYEGGAQVLKLEHDDSPFTSIASAPEARLLVSGSASATVSFHDLRVGGKPAMEWILPKSGEPTAITLFDNNTTSPSTNSKRNLGTQTIAVAQSNGYITLIDARSGLLLQNWRAHSGPISCLRYHKGRLISCSTSTTSYSIGVSVGVVGGGSSTNSLNVSNAGTQNVTSTILNSPLSTSVSGTSNLGGSTPTGTGNSSSSESLVMVWDIQNQQTPKLTKSLKTSKDASFLHFDINSEADEILATNGTKISSMHLDYEDAPSVIPFTRAQKNPFKQNPPTTLNILSLHQLVLIGTETGEITICY